MFPYLFYFKGEENMIIFDQDGIIIEKKVTKARTSTVIYVKKVENKKIKVITDAQALVNVHFNAFRDFIYSLVEDDEVYFTDRAYTYIANRFRKADINAMIYSNREDADAKPPYIYKLKTI
jgi:hypothetical protein